MEMEVRKRIFSMLIEHVTIYKDKTYFICRFNGYYSIDFYIPPI